MVLKFVKLLDADPEKSDHVLAREIYPRFKFERISVIVVNSFLLRGSGGAFGARGLGGSESFSSALYCRKFGRLR
jgi:hypothetical protein